MGDKNEEVIFFFLNNGDVIHCKKENDKTYSNEKAQSLPKRREREKLQSYIYSEI